MRINTIILIVATTVLFSCEQDNKSTSDTPPRDIETSITTGNIEVQKSVTKYNNKYIDTRYKYADPNGKNLIIENSLPKGGLKYTDPNGKEYVYAIFWTRITNEMANPFELSIEVHADSFELPSSPDKYFKIFLPTVKMSIDNIPLFDYGLTDLNAILDHKLQKSSSMQRTINPEERSYFYVITLFNKGVEGTVRAGLSLKNDKLFYRVNDKEIHSGQVSIKDLKLQE